MRGVNKSKDLLDETDQTEVLTPFQSGAYGSELFPVAVLAPVDINRVPFKGTSEDSIER